MGSKQAKAPPGEGLDPTVEELAEQLQLPAWALPGLRVAHGWGEGKRLPLAEFEEQVSAWLSRSMGGDS